MNKIILSLATIILLNTSNTVFAQDMFRDGRITDLKIDNANNFYVQMYDPNNGWPLKGTILETGNSKAMYATALAAKLNGCRVKVYYSYPPAGSSFCVITAIQLFD